MNAVATFVFGLVLLAFATWLNDLEVSAVLVWAFIALGLVMAIPISWFQLFASDD